MTEVCTYIIPFDVVVFIFVAIIAFVAGLFVSSVALHEADEEIEKLRIDLELEQTSQARSHALREYKKLKEENQRYRTALETLSVEEFYWKKNPYRDAHGRSIPGEMKSIFSIREFVNQALKGGGE